MISEPPSSGSAPLVSIGLPVYNGERFIQRALDIVNEDGQLINPVRLAKIIIL